LVFAHPLTNSQLPVSYPITVFLRGSQVVISQVATNPYNLLAPRDDSLPLSAYRFSLTSCLPALLPFCLPPSPRSATLSPMSLTLSWDLFIIVFIAMVITYSFIIGKHESIKIIISSYIAIVTVEAIGNIIQRLFGLTETQSVMNILGIDVDTSITSILKLVLFITAIVFFAVQAGLHIQYAHEHSAALGLLLTGLSGMATAGLLLATILTFVSGMPILGLHAGAAPALSTAMEQSWMLKLLIENQDACFVIPATVLVAAGILTKH
jgi:hypothetical protein